MAKLEIIGAPQSNYVWAVRIAATEKGVPYEHVAVRMGDEMVTSIHPLSKVPVLRHENLRLFESRAIAGYIDDAFDGPDLFPKDPKARAEVEQWVSIVNTAVDPVCIRMYALEAVAPSFLGRPSNVEKMQEAVEKMPALLDALEGGITEAGFLGSDAFTYADANVTPILHYLSMTPEGERMLEERPKLEAYLERMRARPSFAATAPPSPVEA
jgi:glutathione S-transferase